MKKIHQIWITENNQPPPEYIKNKILQLKNLYPDYEYRLYTNADIESLIKSNFEAKVFNAYQTLKPYAFKADLARYCILYLFGGYYWDVTVCPEKKFEFSDNVVLVKGDQGPHGSNGLPIVENNFMFFKTAKNPILKAIIEKITENIYKLDMGVHPLDITGPIALGRALKDADGIKYAEVAVDTDGKKFTNIDGERFYNFKPKEYTAQLSRLGADGTNNYEEMWFAGDVFDYKISYVVITDGKKLQITKKCLKSILNNLRSGDELILVGDVKRFGAVSDKIKLIDRKDLAHSKNISALRNVGVSHSSGNVVVNADDDILFPGDFSPNLENFLRKNTHAVFNTRMLLPTGGRWWDRATYKNGATRLVDYMSTDKNLFYVGTFLIFKRFVFDRVQWNEQVLYYQDRIVPGSKNEDVLMTEDLKRLGIGVNIDLDNYVFHADDTCVTVECSDGAHVIVKKEHYEQNYMKEIKDRDMKNIFSSLVKM